MTEILQIIFTSALTVLGGVIVFVSGQLIVKSFIEPFYLYRKLVGEIAASLIIFANVGPALQDYYLEQLESVNDLDNPKNELLAKRLGEIIEKDWHRMDEAKIVLRQQAGQLLGTTNAIPAYSFWALFRIVPKRKNIIEASSHLIGLSNSTQRDRVESMREKEIADLLRIKVLSKKFGK